MARNGTGPNKSNQIYYTVREDIIDGDYPGGAFITEAALCERFSVSRTPVREALIRLSQDRFVDLIPNKGAIVPHVTINDIIEVLQVRGANEGLAAALLAERHSEELLSKLEGFICREEALLAVDGSDPLEISREDFAFHTLIMRECANRRLTEILEVTDNQMHRFARASADSYAVKTTLPRSVAYHRQALDAIRAGDADAARAAISEHWQVMLNGYVHRSLVGYLPTQI